MDQSKNNGFTVNIDREMRQAQDLKEKKIDDFFHKVDATKRGKIADPPKREPGERYVTVDREVRIFRGENGEIMTRPPDEPAGESPAAAEKKRRSRREKKIGAVKRLKPARRRSVVGRIFGILGRMILGMICLGTIAGCVLAVLGSIYLVNVTRDDDQVLNLNNIELSYATVLTYRDPDTNELVEYQRIFGEENRVWIRYDDIPEHLVDALVASEDQRFWEHAGVDWKMTIGAFLNAYAPGGGFWETARGGSTIVQQLIKNLTDEKETVGFEGALRKLREIYRALIMEKNYSREQILEAYLNTFRLGGTVAGIEAAANYYFDKSCGQLSVAESAAILCVTKNPSIYDPFIDEEENRIQRDTIINQMLEQGYISESQHRMAKAESASMTFSAPNQVVTGTNIYSYMTDTVIDEVLEDFQEILGLSAGEAWDQFSKGGYRVEMTMDPFIQGVLEEVGLTGRQTEDDERSQFPNQEDGYLFPIYARRIMRDDDGTAILDASGEYQYDYTQPQSAMVVMNYKGEILGILGGMDEKTESRSFNRATDGTRSTGSSMKPIAAYGPALEIDAIHFSTLLPDQPLPVGTIPGVNVEWPRNYSRTYGEPVTVASGLAMSLNTTAIHTLRMANIDFCFDYMKNFLGMESLVDPDDRTHSMALGGLNRGVTPLEMCAAYAPFGNGGYYYTPHSYTRVIDVMTGEVVLDKKAHVREIKAFSDDTAYIMNKLLHNVMYSGFVGTGISARPSGDLPYVGKSGTHTDDMDFWFVGMNPYYVMSIWEGYDIQGKMESRRPHPTQLTFRKVMGTISADLEVIDFPTAEGVIQQRFCMQSGDLASPECPDTRIGYYKTGNVPPVCVHQYVPVPPPA